MGVTSLALAHRLLEEQAEATKKLPILIERDLDSLSVFVGQQLLVDFSMLLYDLVRAVQEAVYFIVFSLQFRVDFSEKVLDYAATTCVPVPPHSCRRS